MVLARGFYATKGLGEYSKKLKYKNNLLDYPIGYFYISMIIVKLSNSIINLLVLMHFHRVHIFRSYIGRKCCLYRI